MFFFKICRESLEAEDEAMDISDKILEIVKRKTECVFVSPHLDDAVLSAGSLIAFLAGRVSVKIITVFTEGSDGPLTLSARAFLKQSGMSGAKRLFSARRQEDAEVCEKFGIGWQHLGFIDGLWRKKINLSVLQTYAGKILPELLHVYPVYRTGIVSQKISRHDRPLMGEIAKKLSQTIGDSPQKIIFCPLAIKSHVDHAIVKEVCSRHFGGRLIYWLDYPYSLNYPNAELERLTAGFFKFTYSENWQEKKDSIAGYRSQATALFRDGVIPRVAEQFYVR